MDLAWNVNFLGQDQLNAFVLVIEHVKIILKKVKQIRHSVKTLQGKVQETSKNLENDIYIIIILIFFIL